MIIDVRASVLTEPLIAWLRQQNDDGTPDLRVASFGEDVRVTRYDGSELSESEARHVRGVVAAHAVEPLTMPPVRRNLQRIK